jgi:hypothetical protein
MSVRTADHLEAIRHMPAGATLVIHAFAWDEYERLLEELWDRRVPPANSAVPPIVPRR